MDASAPVTAPPNDPAHAQALGNDLEVLANVGKLLATQSGQQQMLTAVLDALEAKPGMNCIEYGVLLSNDGVIHGHNLPPTLQLPEPAEADNAGLLKTRIHVLERDMLVDALKSCEGNVAAAARQLGITPRMVRYKLKNLGIDDVRSSKSRGDF